MSAQNQEGGKRALLLALLLLLLLPAGQARFKMVPVKPLGGYSSAPVIRPNLHLDSLRNNSYQTSLERYVDSRVGFREWLIRLRNQLSYSLFDVARAKEVLVGRNQVLFEEKPIHTYLGEDYDGPAVVHHHVRRFRAMQDTLARRGKLLVFVAAANKASFMPENLPERYRRQTPRLSNYQAYAAAMRTAGVNFLDLSQALRQWKDTASYPLFPKGGVHWSSYAAKLVGDTLLRYLEHHLPYRLRDFRLKRGDVTTRARDVDDDIAKAMNLLWRPAAYPMAYPNAKPQPLRPGQRQPNLLLIGDSFCWTIMYPFITAAFDSTRSRFWYYNTEVAWPEKRPEGREIWRLDRRKEYLSRDIIIVMLTEYNMNHLDAGFSDNAYNLFTPYSHTDSIQIVALEKQLRKIPHSADWWWARAAETNLSPEQWIHQRAVVKYDSVRD